MKSPHRKPQENHLARPAAGGEWEIWATGSGDAFEPRLIRTTPEIKGPETKTLRIIGLPALHVLGFARWLQTDDETLLAGMVDALLDRNGLAPRQSGGRAVSWEILIREETRTLVIIRTLTGNIPSTLCLERADRYEASVDLQTLPASGIILWPEGGRLAVAFCRANRAVHLQSFPGITISPDIGTELLCTALALENEGILAPLERIELRGEFSDTDAENLAGLLQRPVMRKSLPAPVLPEQASGLLPAQVAEMRQQAQHRQRIESALIGVAALYVFLILAYIANVGWLTFKARQLRAQIAANRPMVETIRATAQRWRALAPAITPSIYPLEVLYQSSGLLPADGVRYTLFEQRANRVTIRGEANDAAAAFKLVEDIKSQKALNYFDWEMPRPNILPNDKAEFQIQGTPPDAPAN